MDTSTSSIGDDVELVAGLSAGLLDVVRRIVNVASISVPIAAGVVLQSAGVAGPVIGGVMFGMFVLLFVVALVAASRVTRTMRLEMQAGYSTLYDVPDFELRDARSKQLLRAVSVSPSGPSHRSWLRSVFRVKPSTPVAKRFDDDGRSGQ